MVGPFGETLKFVLPRLVGPFVDIFLDRYFYSDPVYLLGEIDGTRIISKDTCEFLQKVPRQSNPQDSMIARLISFRRIVARCLPTGISFASGDSLRGRRPFREAFTESGRAHSRHSSRTRFGCRHLHRRGGTGIRGALAEEAPQGISGVSWYDWELTSSDVRLQHSERRFSISIIRQISSKCHKRFVY